MSDKRFLRILITIIVLGLILTALHIVYIIHAYQNASIIQFIAREWWP